jgi:hypothetical protein
VCCFKSNELQLLNIFYANKFVTLWSVEFYMKYFYPVLLKICVHRVLVGKPKGTRPLGRPIRRWEDNSKMDLQEVGGGCGDWMERAQDRDSWRALVSTVMNRVP